MRQLLVVAVLLLALLALNGALAQFLEPVAPSTCLPRNPQIQGACCGFNKHEGMRECSALVKPRADAVSVGSLVRPFYSGFLLPQLNLYENTTFQPLNFSTTAAYADFVRAQGLGLNLLTDNCRKALVELTCAASFAECIVVFHAYTSPPFNATYQFPRPPSRSLCQAANTLCASSGVALDCNATQLTPPIPEFGVPQGSTYTYPDETHPQVIPLPNPLNPYDYSQYLVITFPSAEYPTQDWSYVPQHERVRPPPPESSACKYPTKLDRHFDHGQAPCRLKCPVPLYEDNQMLAMNIVTTFFAYINFFTLLFLVISWLFNAKRRAFPRRLPMFVFLCAVCNMTIFMVGVLLRGHYLVQCADEYTPSTMNNNWLCAISGIIAIFFGMASAGWWGMIALNTFLQAAVNINPVPWWLEIFYHVYCWAPPLITTLVALVMQDITAASGLFTCFIDQTNNRDTGIAYGMFWVYLTGNLIICLVLTTITILRIVAVLGCGMGTLSDQRGRSLKRGSKRFISTLILYARFVAFQVIFVLTWSTTFGNQLTGTALKDDTAKSFRDWIQCAFSATGHNCGLETRPPYGYAFVSSWMTTFSGILVFFVFGTDPSIYVEWYYRLKHLFTGKFDLLLAEGIDDTFDSTAASGGGGSSSTPSSSSSPASGIEDEAVHTDVDDSSGDQTSDLGSGPGSEASSIAPGLRGPRDHVRPPQNLDSDVDSGDGPSSEEMSSVSNRHAGGAAAAASGAAASSAASRHSSRSSAASSAASRSRHSSASGSSLSSDSE